MNRIELVPAIVLAVGLVVGGWCIGSGFEAGRTSDRFVTVKGVSEREVEADVALWPLRFVATDDLLDRAQNKIKSSETKVLEFLSRHDIPAESTEVQLLQVTDRLANAYSNNGGQSRYIIAETLMVRTDQPDLVVAASQAVGELVDAGVVLSAEYSQGSTPTYLFTELNQYKPEMIAEATANARQAGDQFAADSGAKLGEIRRANQGLFQILPRDPAPGVQEHQQVQKILRVVSTIDFYLQD